MDSTLPGCIGYYGKPTPPNRCDTCNNQELCKVATKKKRKDGQARE